MRADTASTIRASRQTIATRCSPKPRAWALQESQARLWENHVGRSRAFWDYVFPRLQRLFPDAVSGLDAESVLPERQCGAARAESEWRQTRSPIICTSCSLRARGRADLGRRSAFAICLEAWNERSTSLIGATPTSDREGVLQDVHWSLGMFGYFPTYTLGSLYAAQLAETYAREHPLEDEIRRGEFGGLLTWLRTKIHRVGQRFSAEELIEKATGKRLDAAAFFRYIEAKHLS